MSIKFAVIADTHLPYLTETVQYAAFDWAIKEICKNAPDFTVFAGDATTYGDIEAFEFFEKKIKEFNMPCHVIMGNADLRKKETTEKAISLRNGFEFIKDGKEFICIDTSTAEIGEKDRERIEKSSSDAVIFMHHSVQGLHDNSREFLTNWANTHKGLIIHAHSHKSQDYYIGKTRVVGVRCIDPEKSVEAPPCITLFELSDDKLSYTEIPFDFPKDNIKDFRKHMGISCFDIYGDIDFAIENDLKAIEIRKFDGSDEELSFLINKVRDWREKGGETVSVHMPNLKWNGETFDGLSEWAGAVRIVKEVNAETVTVHPPRKVYISDMKRGSSFYINILNLFCEKLMEISEDIKMGIENIHFDIYDVDLNNRFFGYEPDELLGFVEDINKKFGFERVGNVFDIGHAKNNGPCYTRNTLGVWFEKIGKKITAYHIHQVAEGENGKINHAAITNWEGQRNICFTAFLWAWQTNRINHKSMFMEMRNRENCKISLDSLDRYLKSNL